MSRMTPLRWGACALLLILGVLLETSFFDAFAWNGVVPDLVLLVVVAVGLAEGSRAGMVLGFAGGLLLDLAPPADHIAGRWALALLIAGYVAGRVRQGDDSIRTGLFSNAAGNLATVGACVFVATSVYALSGLVLHDHTAPPGHVLAVIAISLVWDLPLAMLVLPGVAALLRVLDLERLPVR